MKNGVIIGVNLDVLTVKMTEFHCTVKLGDKERFDKEQICVKKPFSVTNCQFIS